MKLSITRRSGRRGFTLVELLIVIAIIGLLVSLLSAAVWKAVSMSNRVRNQNDISQLAVAVENCKAKFGVYPPSKMILCENENLYHVGNNLNAPFKSQLHADSLAILQQIWPRLKLPRLGGGPSLTVGWIDWGGKDFQRLPHAPPAEYLLEGDQCLVFFLGGIPGKDSSGNVFCSGFSTNPENPAFHTSMQGTETMPPFFEFQGGIDGHPRTRLVVLPVSSRSQRHFSYRDTYGTAPYAYFSSYNTRNGYNRSLRYGNDCSSLRVWPYAEGLTPTIRYLNPNTFQIISAGANGIFGQGTNLSSPSLAAATIWSPTIAGSSQAIWGMDGGDPKAGDDDQSNFYDTTLGSGS